MEKFTPFNENEDLPEEGGFSEQALRMSALSESIRSSGGTDISTEELVSRAEAFLKFIKG